MPHIVSENCQGCRFTDCVETCPVACFHGDGERLYIDPEVCIDCAACIPACPVHAIYDVFDDMPAEHEPWIAVNAERAPNLPVIDSKQEPQATAEARKAELGY